MNKKADIAVVFLLSLLMVLWILTLIFDVELWGGVIVLLMLIVFFGWCVKVTRLQPDDEDSQSVPKEQIR